MTSSKLPEVNEVTVTEKFVKYAWNCPRCNNKIEQSFNPTINYPQNKTNYLCYDCRTAINREQFKKEYGFIINARIIDIEPEESSCPPLELRSILVAVNGNKYTIKSDSVLEIEQVHD